MWVINDWVKRIRARGPSMKGMKPISGQRVDSSPGWMVLMIFMTTMLMMVVVGVVLVNEEVVRIVLRMMTVGGESKKKGGNPENIQFQQKKEKGKSDDAEWPKKIKNAILRIGMQTWGVAIMETRTLRAASQATRPSSSSQLWV